MKNRNIKFAGALLLALLMVTSVDAQRRQGGRGLGPYGGGDGFGYRSVWLDLTEEQQEELSALRTEHSNEITPLRDKMAELRASERTLLSEEDVDIEALEKNIDEQSDLMNNMRKLQARHQLAVQDILTDEQVEKLQQRRQYAQRDGFYGKGSRRGNWGMRMDRDYRMGRSYRMDRGYRMNRGYRMQDMQMDRPYGRTRNFQKI